MINLKIYMHTNHSLDSMLNTYKQVFNAQEIKKSICTQEKIDQGWYDQPMLGKTTYANIKLFNSISIMFSRWTPKFNLPYGNNNSLIINFDKNTKLFNQIYDNMKASPAFKMQYSKDIWTSWGTQIAKFHDIFDNAWVLELDTRKHNN